MDMTTLKNAVNSIAVNPSNDPHSVHKANPGETDIPNRVFVKGFPREATEDDLKNFFEEYGMVHESKIVKDKSGMQLTNILDLYRTMQNVVHCLGYFDV